MYIFLSKNSSISKQKASFISRGLQGIASCEVQLPTPQPVLQTTEAAALQSHFAALQFPEEHIGHS